MRRILSLVVVSLCACSGSGGGGGGADPDAPGAPDDGGDDQPDAPPGPTPITVTLHEADDVRVSLVTAWQDGTGAWTLLSSTTTTTPATNRTFTFTATSPTWSFAWGCAGLVSNEWQSSLTVVSFSSAERTSYDAPSACPRGLQEMNVGGTLLNAPPTSDHYDFGYGPRNDAVLMQHASSVTFTIHNYDAGPRDLYAALDTPADGGGQFAQKVVVVRGVTAPTISASINLDSALATSDPLAVTITSPGATTSQAYTELFDSTGTHLRLTNTNLGPPHETRGLDVSQLQPDDVYIQSAKALTCVTTGCDSAEQQRWTQTLATQTLSLAAGLGAVAATGTDHELAATWPAYPGALGYQWSASQNGELSFAGVIGAGYAALRGPSFALPQLTEFRDASLLPDTNTEVSGKVTAVMSTSGAADFPLVDHPPTGTERTLVSSYLYRPSI